MTVWPLAASLIQVLASGITRTARGSIDAVDPRRPGVDAGARTRSSPSSSPSCRRRDGPSGRTRRGSPRRATRGPATHGAESPRSAAMGVHGPTPGHRPASPHTYGANGGFRHVSVTRTLGRKRSSRLPRISFCIPYYQNHQYLMEAIESVRAQSMPDWDLVVVDDCGPEPAEDLVAVAGRRPRPLRAQRREPGAQRQLERVSGTGPGTVGHDPARGRPPAAGLRRARARGGRGSPGRRGRRVHRRAGRRLLRAAHSTVADTCQGAAPATAGRPRPPRGRRPRPGSCAATTSTARRCASPRAASGPDPFKLRWRFVPDWELHQSGAARGRRAAQPSGSSCSSTAATRHSETARCSPQTRPGTSRSWTFSVRWPTRAAGPGLARSARTARHRVMVRGHVLAAPLVGRRCPGGRGSRGSRRSARILSRAISAEWTPVGVDDPDPQE